MADAVHLHGLAEEEAAARLARAGPNIVREPRSRTIVHVARDTLREPMFMLLLGAAALYLLVGDLAEGIFLACGALLSFGLVIAQEARSERALRALNALAEPRAWVVRSGHTRQIPASELVPGDIMLVAEGSRIQADAMLLQGDALEVDESALTGESAPTTKRPAEEAPAGDVEFSPGEGLTPALFASTMVVRGHGQARVTRTGARTAVGRIGVELGALVEQPTLLQRDVGRLIRLLGLLAVCFCAAVVLAYGLLRGDWFGGALSGLTLAISLIPEEFPMVLAIFMAAGAWRLARQNVLVRRSAVIETLGATTLLCVDKTGTITENRMILRRIWTNGMFLDPSTESLAAGTVIRAARMASAVQPHDPMDLAIHAALPQPQATGPIRSYPLRPQFLAYVQVWPDGGRRVVYAAKGAHETVLSLCPLDEASRVQAEAAAHALASEGMRVLAAATARCREGRGNR